MLSPSQNDAMKHYLEGHSFFLTGPGGSGKSHIIQHIRNINPQKTAVTAMTGCAAVLLNCEAVTLHSWAGIGYGKDPIEKIVKFIQSRRKLKDRWRNVSTLIIDEVSMLGAELFDKLNAIAKSIRNSNLPFGGIQLILSGDFCQIPPINEDLIFTCNSWKECIKHIVVLREIHRQKNPEFQQILNRIRLGICNESDKQILKSRIEARKIIESLEIKPTRIFPTNDKADAVNNAELEKLPEPSFNYTVEPIVNPSAKLTETEIKAAIERMDKTYTYSKNLKLKKGAQVMLLINRDFESELVNGSRGIVIDFTESKLPIVRFYNGVVTSISKHTWECNDTPGLSQIGIPLRLAWAISCHKAQGLSIDCIDIDIGDGIFEFGQSYVALSRVKSLDGLFISDFNPKRIKVHPQIKEFYNSIPHSCCN